MATVCSNESRSFVQCFASASALLLRRETRYKVSLASAPSLVLLRLGAIFPSFIQGLLPRFSGQRICSRPNDARRSGSASVSVARKNHNHEKIRLLPGKVNTFWHLNRPLPKFIYHPGNYQLSGKSNTQFSKVPSNLKTQGLGSNFCLPYCIYFLKQWIFFGVLNIHGVWFALESTLKGCCGIGL